MKQFHEWWKGLNFGWHLWFYIVAYFFIAGMVFGYLAKHYPTMSSHDVIPISLYWPVYIPYKLGAMIFQ